MSASEPIATGDMALALLVNPSAGGGRSRGRLPEIEAAMREGGLSYRLVMTRDLDDGREQARRAAAQGEVPVVVSGDGLIGAAGGVLAGGDAPLGIIPGGRGNDLARVLGIPTDPAGAVAVLAEGRTRRLDVGEANGVPFLGIASCGFDSEANRIANEARVVRGPLVYAYAALRALAAWKPARFRVKADGVEHAFSGYAVAVANSKAYGGGMLLAPDAELDDGRLDVVMTAHGGKLRFVASLPRVFKGTHIEREQVSVVRASEVEITADRPFAVYADGDPITELPARIRVRPAALRVIAPTGS